MANAISSVDASGRLNAGSVALFDNFETFQQNLKDMHIEDLIAVEQAALDRYNAR